MDRNAIRAAVAVAMPPEMSFALVALTSIARLRELDARSNTRFYEQMAYLTRDDSQHTFDQSHEMQLNQR